MRYRDRKIVIYDHKRTHSIISVIGNHNEQLARHAFWRSFGDEHVLWPSATAEVELSEGISSSGSTGVQVTECALEWNRHRRLSGRTFDIIRPLFHYINYKLVK